MSSFRFKVGDRVMCNLGPSGWKLGRVIALHYREDHWPDQQTAPYQVLLDLDHMLIYVPEDDARYCRKATQEDLLITQRMDALASAPSTSVNVDDQSEPQDRQKIEQTSVLQLSCTGETVLSLQGIDRSRSCQGCHHCPHNWTYVELFSEHYRCASRHHLKITRHKFDLGTVSVGASIHCLAGQSALSKTGYSQCPTLVRLPPGLHFSDEGTLSGQVQFDPSRDPSYPVQFVAVSTVAWRDPAIGLVRIEISFLVENNHPPGPFDLAAFTHKQEHAREEAKMILHRLCDTWEMWEEEKLSNQETCKQMHEELDRLREILEVNPTLDRGYWWVHLGGFYMNVHKLLDNTLFECERYLGHALMFEDAEIRRMAEQNLEGCYQKRLLEAARSLWIDGTQQMLQGNWKSAADTFNLAAAQHDGWGWAVNYGDIWMSESAARLIQGVTLMINPDAEGQDATEWMTDASRLLDLASTRANEAAVFGIEGHPWIKDLKSARDRLHQLTQKNLDLEEWLETFKQQTTYWCAQILAGVDPFPPQPRPRRHPSSMMDLSKSWSHFE